MIQPGDCVIAFSRREIYRLREAIQEATGHKCCVVYGALPPETRSTQARLFNDPDSGFDVLIASDAIGMGLNLNIKRIVFSTLQKFDGDAMRFISVEEVRKGVEGRCAFARSERARCPVLLLRR